MIGAACLLALALAACGSERSVGPAAKPSPPHQGRYISATAGATPTESWLAARLDHLAALEAERGWSRPLTFTNWLTTDPLHHPEEPMGKEDMVSVDAKHLRATAQWPGGFFASYHAYPYYPDFMRLQPSSRRAKDPYEAYLKDLRAHHGRQAVMITEFGVPTGIGSAHLGPLGRGQGDHSEQEAGRMDADMLAAIHRQKMSGALLFAYTDEWFKRTWNTMDMEKPEERRPLWHNALTNEEQFGIVAAEAGKKAAATVDGSDREWTRTQSQQIYEGGGTVREVRAIHDANWLYLLVRRSGDKPLQLGFDVRPGGNKALPGRPGTEPEADVSISLGPGRKAVLHEAAWTDPIGFEVGLLDGHPDGSVETLKVGRLGIDVAPAGEAPVSTNGYGWDPWNRVDYHERRKAGWPTVQRAMRAFAER